MKNKLKSYGQQISNKSMCNNYISEGFGIKDLKTICQGYWQNQHKYSPNHQRYLRNHYILLVQSTYVLPQSVDELTQSIDKWAQSAKGVHGKQGGISTIKHRDIKDVD